MNYISHYYNSEKESNYYKLGLVLPDIYPNFSFLHNKYFVEYQDKHLLTPQELDLWEGIEQHYMDDSIFHNLSQFDNFVHQTMKDFEANPILKPIQRKNFVGHIFLEIIIDHLILKDQPDLVYKIYDDIESIQEDVVTSFFNKIILESDKNQLFLKNFRNFKTKKFLEYYKIKRNLVVALYKVTGKIAKWELNEEIERELIAYIDNYRTENNYLEIFKQIEKTKKGI